MSGDECRFDANWYCHEHNAFPLQCGYAGTQAAAQLEAILAAEKRNHADDHKDAAALQARLHDTEFVFKKTCDELDAMEARVESEETACRKWEEDFVRFHKIRMNLEARVRELEGQLQHCISSGEEHIRLRREAEIRLSRAEAAVERLRGALPFLASG